jgi:hypothetical protein
MQVTMYSCSKTKYIEYNKSIKHVLNVLWYKMRCLFLRSFILLFYDVYSSNNQWWTMMRNPNKRYAFVVDVLFFIFLTTPRHAPFYEYMFIYSLWMIQQLRFIWYLRMGDTHIHIVIWCALSLQKLNWCRIYIYMYYESSNHSIFRNKNDIFL